MRKPIDENIKTKVMEKKLSKQSNAVISKELNISETSVSRILKEKNFEGKNLKGGRPRIINNREENLLIRNFDNGTIQNTTQGVSFSKEFFNKSVSNTSIRRILKKNDFKNYKKVSKPEISKKILYLGKISMKNTKISIIKIFRK